MNNKRGFLLLEVIVAIAILTGGLVFVTRVYSTAKYAIQRSFVIFRSGLLLESRMFEFEEKGKIRDYLKEGKVFSDDRDYSWRLSAAPVARDPVLQESLGLDSVILEVSRNRDKEEKRSYITMYSIATYLKGMK